MVSKQIREQALNELADRAWDTRDRELLDKALRVARMMGQSEGIDMALLRMNKILVNTEKVE